MLRDVVLLTILFHICQNVVQSEKQQVRLSDSYLPVVMQVIHHLTDQMAFEVKDDPPPKTTTTAKPLDVTTPFHKPGLYAPPSPPKPSDRVIPKSANYVLLPVENNSQHTVIEPEELRTEEPLLAAHNEEVKPLVEPIPSVAHHLLPYEQDLKISSRSDNYDNEYNEESLQYLSPNIRDLIKMAHDPNEERVVKVWESLRSNPGEPSSKGKLSSSNLRLLLLYDLLSRDAKKQRLSDYSGFSSVVMKNLVDSSNGGAREQLGIVLSKMVERQDCTNQYANNRAKEMVVELTKDESVLSSELRYLQPLIYKF